MGPNGPMATTQQGAVGRAVRNCDRIGRKGVVWVVDIWIRRRISETQNLLLGPLVLLGTFLYEKMV